MLYGGNMCQFTKFYNKKLSYRRCVVSIEILPIAMQQAETTYTTSADQIDWMKLEI